MKTPSRHKLLMCALLLGALLSTSTASAQGNCELAFNIVHCPIGQANLQVAPDGSQLLVTGLGSAGNDGVSSEFDTAVHWRAQMSVEEPASELTFRAHLDGSTTASASFQTEGNTNEVELRTSFTGATGPHTYRAIILDDGQQVADFGGLDETSSIIIGRIPVPVPIPRPGPWPWPDFKRLSSGACAWQFSYSGGVTFTTSNGDQAVGDTVRLVEDVDKGHYLYAGFTAITTQSDASSLTITNEQISN